MGSVIHAADVVVEGASLVVEDRHVSLALPDSYGIEGGGISVQIEDDGVVAVSAAIYYGKSDDEVARITIVKAPDGSVRLTAPFQEGIWIAGPASFATPIEEN